MLKFFKYLLPHWLFILVQRRRQKRILADRLQQAQIFDHRKRSFEMNSEGNSSSHQFDYEDAVDFLIRLGISEEHVRGGSIPETSLKKIWDVLSKKYSGKPVKGIHVGNFLGVSLGFMCQAIKDIHPDSIMVSVDPNIPHRGVMKPNDFAIALLKRYNLLNMQINIQGYSLGKSLSNDGVNYDNQYDPFSKFESEISAENQLQVLSKLAPTSFDFIMLDGNHNSTYLQQEIQIATSLLKPGSYIILDDVDDNWPAIKEIFLNIGDQFKHTKTDGRIGILELLKSS